MNFLDEIYFDNPIRNYLMVLAAIVIALIFKKLLSRFIASLLFIPFKKFGKAVGQRAFTDLVIQPLGVAIVILVSVLAIDRLNFPSQLDFAVYHVTFHQIIDAVFIIVIISCIIWLFVRGIDFIAIVIKAKADTNADPRNNQLIFFFKDFLKVVIIIIGIICILKFGFDAHIGELITGLSIVGAALALAAKESLENLIASFIIFFDKPFTAGDLVKINNYQGYVETIGLRSTRLRTLDKTQVIVPNKQMVDSILDNWSVREVMRNEIKVDVSPLTPAAKLELIIGEINNLFQSRSDKIRSHSVFLSEINKAGSLIIVEYFTDHTADTSVISQLRHELNFEIKKIIEGK